MIFVLHRQIKQPHAKGRRDFAEDAKNSRKTFWLFFRVLRESFASFAYGFRSSTAPSIHPVRLQQTLAAANMGLPAGSVVDKTGGKTRMLTVETGNLITSADEVADLVVGVSNGRPVYLREVARVEYGAQSARR